MATDLKDMVRQCMRDSQRWFPEVADNLNYYGLAQAGEAGELANKIKKVWCGVHSLEETRADIAEEAVDVLIYLCNIFALLGVDPIKLYAIKRAKNERRFGNGRVSGNG